MPLIPATIIAVMLFFAAFAPVVAPSPPNKGSLKEALRPPAWSQGGSWRYPLGTDYAGRDILSRVIYGARVSLSLAALSIPMGVLLGVSLGVVAGYFGGWADIFIMRLVDAALSMPGILLAMVLAGVFGASFLNLVIIIAMVSWPGYARISRGETLSVRERDFVGLARVAGCSTPHILVRHILPNIINSIVVLATLMVGSVILLEAALSFLGIGIRPPTPTWGGMLNEARGYITKAWWLAVFPGAAIAVTVLSINLFGDWLRDRLDPKLRQV
ncbi:MAG: ABC transporter permease [Chloroflexi bacterium]|nr:ABC transporter permease [Chloroflexota bacterium]